MAYTTLEDVKAYLGITETTDDAIIESSIAAAKLAIDNYCSTSFDVSDDTTRLFDCRSDLIAGRSLHLDRHTLAEAPVSVTIDGVNVTDAVKVYGDAPYHELILSGSSGYSWRGMYGSSDPEDAISITGKWGYSTTPPSDVVRAAVIWSSHLYQIKDAAPDGTLSLSTVEEQQRVVAIPVNARELLSPYRRHW